MKKITKKICCIIMTFVVIMTPTVAFAAGSSVEGQDVSPRYSGCIANDSGTALSGTTPMGRIGGINPPRECIVIVNCKYLNGSSGTCWLNIGSWSQKIVCDGVSRVVHNNEGEGPRIGETGGIWEFSGITSQMRYVISIYYN